MGITNNLWYVIQKLLNFYIIKYKIYITVKTVRFMLNLD